MYVDSIESCIKESGDIIIPLRDGIITEDHTLGEIGSVVLDETEIRKSDKDITVFKSVGIAVQDVFVANEAYQRITGNSE
ncbi:Delta(1)-pyrroline-2-carboxylate reductase [subsurface metagenome]